MEAKYLHPAKCIRKVLYLRQIFREFGGFHEPNIIYEDIQHCILWLQTMAGKISTGMGDTILFCKAVMSGEVKLEHCPTTEVIADMLPEPLGLQNFLGLRRLMQLMASLPFSDDS